MKEKWSKLMEVDILNNLCTLQLNTIMLTNYRYLNKKKIKKKLQKFLPMNLYQQKQF